MKKEVLKEATSVTVLFDWIEGEKVWRKTEKGWCVFSTGPDGTLKYLRDADRVEISRVEKIFKLNSDLKSALSANFALELDVRRLEMEARRNSDAPTGFASWYDAAVDERMKRVKIEAELKKLKAMLEE